MFMIGVSVKADLNVHEDSHIFETQFHVSCIIAEDDEVVEGGGQTL